MDVLLDPSRTKLIISIQKVKVSFGKHREEVLWLAINLSRAAKCDVLVLLHLEAALSEELSRKMIDVLITTP